MCWTRTYSDEAARQTRVAETPDRTERTPETKVKPTEPAPTAPAERRREVEPAE